MGASLIYAMSCSQRKAAKNKVFLHWHAQAACVGGREMQGRSKVKKKVIKKNSLGIPVLSMVMTVYIKYC